MRLSFIYYTNKSSLFHKIERNRLLLSLNLNSKSLKHEEVMKHYLVKTNMTGLLNVRYLQVKLL